MMDHDSVIDNKTPERYMLGELTDAEGDAYEEHYFECPECAEELRSGVEFMHCAREVMQQEAATQFFVADRDGTLPIVHEHFVGSDAGRPVRTLCRAAIKLES